MYKNGKIKTCDEFILKAGDNMEKTTQVRIVNRNDNGYLLVKKTRDNKSYYVYLDRKNVLKFNDHVFHATFGDDQKLKVNEFIEKVFSEYSSLNEYQDCYDSLKYVYEKISASDPKNPDLRGLEVFLFNGLDMYNSLCAKKSESLVPYKDNLKLVEGTAREIVLNNEKNFRKDEPYMEKGSARIYKYDN